MKKKIFLTGSNGYIGSFLKSKLQKKYIIISSDVSKGDNLDDDNYLKYLKIKSTQLFFVMDLIQHH